MIIWRIILNNKDMIFAAIVYFTLMAFSFLLVPEGFYSRYLLFVAQFALFVTLVLRSKYLSRFGENCTHLIFISVSTFFVLLVINAFSAVDASQCTSFGLQKTCLAIASAAVAARIRDLYEILDGWCRKGSDN